jgi:hypothetical protein
MNRLSSILVVWALALLPAPVGHAMSLLWSKTITSENGAKLALALGADGSVAVADAYLNAQKIYWYDRYGILLQTIVPVNSYVYGFVYVSKDEVITQYRNAELKSAMELFQLVDGQLGRVEVQSSLGLISNEYKFSYPYLLESKVNGSTYELKLYDLTSSVAPAVVGDAVIGVHGKNLLVRWKSLSTANYKVQTSNDLATWTDYTDVLNGTGSTLVISIPLPADSSAQYARVIKL